MSLLRKTKDFIKHFIPDKMFIKHKFYKRFGYKLDLKNPRTYNEKSQWQKLYDRNPVYSDMVDKYKARNIVEQKIGNNYLIPLLGHWNNFEEIDFDSLPQKFVLKTTHDSGGVWIIEKNNVDLTQIKKEVNKHLKENFFWASREWPYKNVKPSIIAEKFMVDETRVDFKDYKFYCFNGNVKLLMIASDIHSSEHINNHKSHDYTLMDYYDENLNNVKINWGFNYSENPGPLPSNINELKQIAEKLSEGINSVRVDLYTDLKNIYFGEFTFYDGAGFDKIEPQEWDYKLGSYITII